MSRKTIARARFDAQVRHRIRIVAAVVGINNKQLARDAGLSYSIVNNVLNCTHVSPKLGNLARIADGLGFSLDALVGPVSKFAYNVAKTVRQMA